MKMIWIVLHWVFLFMCQPHCLFHLITSILLVIYQRFITKKKINVKKNLQDIVGVTLMYIGFYISGQLYHFAFLPFWGVSVIGLRGKLPPLIIFSVVTGLTLHFIVLKQVIGHVFMNTGRILRVRSVNVDTTIVSHGIIFIFSFFFHWKPLQFTQREVLGVVSTLHMIGKFERMDVFSLCMCYTHFFALLLPLLHLSMPNWYNYYENNHFYMVKRQYLFVIPIGLIIQRFIYAVF